MRPVTPFIMIPPFCLSIETDHSTTIASHLPKRGAALRSTPIHRGAIAQIRLSLKQIALGSQDLQVAMRRKENHVGEGALHGSRFQERAVLLFVYRDRAGADVINPAVKLQA